MATARKRVNLIDPPKCPARDGSSTDDKEGIGMQQREQALLLEYREAVAQHVAVSNAWHARIVQGHFPTTAEANAFAAEMEQLRIDAMQKWQAYDEERSKLRLPE